MKVKMKKIWYYFSLLTVFSVKLFSAIIISFFVRYNKKYKNIWLIAERMDGDEARDNGYWFFKYIMENHPKTNAYFVLSKKSVDYHKIERYGSRIIEPSSFKHYLYFVLSRRSISSHMHGASPAKAFCVPFLPLMPRKKTVFLQHGITKDRIKFRAKIDMISCSSELEKNCIISGGNKEATVKMVGMCRYDGLKDESRKEKVILVMPTFRRWLRDLSRLSNALELFEKEEYYKRWNSLLNNEELLKFLEENDTKLVFYPHYEMHKYLSLFHSNSQNVIIAKKSDYDIQDLLKKSSILITDFSSVFFDFSYMKKPLVYYQYDEKRYREGQYKEGDFSYKKDGFGPVIYDENQLVLQIIKSSNHNYQLEKEYWDRNTSFFMFADNENCKRNYEEIEKM